MRTITVAAILGIMAGTVSASMVYIPPEILAGKSDLIVVAEAVSVGELEELTVELPDYPKPLKSWFRKAEVKITRVIREVGGKAGPVDEERKITILTRAAEPRKPDGPMVVVCGVTYVTPKPGLSYVLMLRKLKDKPGYFLPSYPDNFQRARPDRIEKVEQAANVEGWPWGKAVNGLQIALIPTSRKLRLVRVGRGGGFGGKLATGNVSQTAQVHAVVALRNVSKAPITISLYPEDRFLSITATGPDGAVVQPALYRSLDRMDLRGFGSWATAKIGSGEMKFIAPMGKGDYGIGLGLELSEGKGKLWAGYSVQKGPRKDVDDEGGEKAIKVWNGRIESKPVEIEVTANVSVVLPRGVPIRVRGH